MRPLDGHYQIVSGHHRVEAARQAGLKEIPCWVKEMTDEEAHLELVLSNRQGELSPLELGIHALETVGKGERGRGKTGGMREYARLIGKAEGYIRGLVQAAEVYGIE